MSKRNPRLTIKRDGTVLWDGIKKGRVTRGGFMGMFVAWDADGRLYRRWKHGLITNPRVGEVARFSYQNDAVNALLLAAGVMEETDPKGVQKDGEEKS